MKAKTSILALTKVFFILFVSCCLFSCTEDGNAVTGDTTYSTEIIDGCEYLKRYDGYHSGYSFHTKGIAKIQYIIKLFTTLFT